MTDAQTEARATLRIDEKWSVEYDPSNNDSPGRVLRYGEPVTGGSTDWKNDTRAMFYALLERNAALAAKDAELAEVVREIERLKNLVGDPQGTADHAEAFLARAERAEAALAEARKALEPFAAVAEHDIGGDETDDDIFWPISAARYSMSGRLRVGHLRVARRVREGGKVE